MVYTRPQPTRVVLSAPEDAPGPAAVVAGRGDKDFAKERALKMVMPVVGLMQVAGAIYHHLDDVIRQMS
jgi:hypothetical protein